MAHLRLGGNSYATFILQFQCQCKWASKGTYSRPRCDLANYRQPTKRSKCQNLECSVTETQKYRNQTAQHMKIAKKILRTITLHFGEKLCMSTFTHFLRNRGGLDVRVSFQRVALVTRFIIIRQMSPPASGRVPSGLPLP